MDQTPQGLAKGARAVAAIRPERLHLGLANADNSLTERIAAMAYHGPDLQLHAQTPLAPMPVLARLTAVPADREPVSVGDEVTLRWLARDTLIFAEDGEPT
ncbi:MAG: TOBE domain-containing protein [Pseudomonadota bacterium]